MDKPNLTHPPYWLVLALPWPEDAAANQPAECALAVAPTTIRRNSLSHAAESVFGATKILSERNQTPVVFLAEAIAFLHRRGTTTEVVDGVDEEAVVNELADAPTLAVFMNLYRRGHALLSTAAIPEVYINGRLVDPQEKEELRASLLSFLREEWPAYVRRL